MCCAKLKMQRNFSFFLHFYFNLFPPLTNSSALSHRNSCSSVLSAANYGWNETVVRECRHCLARNKTGMSRGMRGNLVEGRKTFWISRSETIRAMSGKTQKQLRKCLHDDCVNDKVMSLSKQTIIYWCSKASSAVKHRFSRKTFQLRLRIIAARITTMRW